MNSGIVPAFLACLTVGKTHAHSSWKSHGQKCDQQPRKEQLPVSTGVSAS